MLKQQMLVFWQSGSYLSDTVCDSPGEKDSWHDLEPSQDHGGWYDSWGHETKDQRLMYVQFFRFFSMS